MSTWAALPPPAAQPPAAQNPDGRALLGRRNRHLISLNSSTAQPAGRPEAGASAQVA